MDFVRVGYLSSLGKEFGLDLIFFIGKKASISVSFFIVVRVLGDFCDRRKGEILLSRC